MFVAMRFSYLCRSACAAAAWAGVDSAAAALAKLFDKLNGPAVKNAQFDTRTIFDLKVPEQ